MTRGAPKGADQRRGAPRPLAAHVLAAASDLQNGVALALGAADSRFPWRPGLREEGSALGKTLAELDPERVRDAVAKTALADLSAALDGVAAYQETPALRRPKTPPVIWREGAAQLFDFGALAPAPATPDPRPAVLALPSMVNSPLILDISQARSLLRGLAQRGLRPFLLDWGDPGREERNFDLDLYLRRRVFPALERVAEVGGGPVALLGHCMSGSLAAGAAARRGALVSRLALLAAPWDFASLRPEKRSGLGKKELSQLIDACGAVFGGVPSDLLNTLFFIRDPLQATRKFPAFARKGRRSAHGRRFVAVEDWLNQGPRLAAPAARTLLLDWSFDNHLARGLWRVEGRKVSPRQVTAPTLVIASKADTVAPYAAASAAAQALPNARLHMPSGGHVGMVIGGRAEEDLWDPLAAFLRGDSDGEPA